VFTFTPVAGVLSLTISGDVFFAQCETGMIATSWIPTWNTAGLRRADDVHFDVASLGTWLSPSAGTFFLEANRFGLSSRGDFLHLRNSADAALGDVNVSGGAGGSLNVSMRKVEGDFRVTSPGALTSASHMRAAFAYGDGEGAVAINGSSAISSADVLGLSHVNAMMIGSNFGPTRHFLNGHVRRVRHYGSRLSNIVLQRISA
jgi:hypothetical protein